jgi:hypothetical protein
MYPASSWRYDLRAHDDDPHVLVLITGAVTVNRLSSQSLQRVVVTVPSSCSLLSRPRWVSIVIVAAVEKSYKRGCQETFFSLDWDRRDLWTSSPHPWGMNRPTHCLVRRIAAGQMAAFAVSYARRKTPFGSRHFASRDRMLATTVLFATRGLQLSLVIRGGIEWEGDSVLEHAWPNFPMDTQPRTGASQNRLAIDRA